MLPPLAPLREVGGNSNGGNALLPPLRLFLLPPVLVRRRGKQRCGREVEALG